MTVLPLCSARARPAGPFAQRRFAQFRGEDARSRSLAFRAVSATVRAMQARRIEVDVGAAEDRDTTFARDQWMALGCANDGAARARVWRRAADGLSLGRFHRIDPAAAGARDAAADDRTNGRTGGSGGLSRRLSGGRIVPVGPGVACITLVAPNANWLDPAGASLRPDQVLNRALRPLLAMLRGEGIDAYYPGRDLVTVGGRTIAHASFTVMRDGVTVVEMHVAELPAFPSLAGLLDRLDPAGIAGVDREALHDATSVLESGASPRDDQAWAELFAARAATAFGAEARVVSQLPAAGTGAALDPAAHVAASGIDVTFAHASAARDLLAAPGPVAAGAATAAAVSMLGVVECSLRRRGDRIAGLEITGDLIAPFHTLDDIRSECEGEPLRPANVRKALARAMARPRSFLLGIRDLDELILRQA